MVGDLCLTHWAPAVWQPISNASVISILAAGEIILENFIARFKISVQNGLPIRNLMTLAFEIMSNTLSRLNPLPETNT